MFNLANGVSSKRLFGCFRVRFALCTCTFFFSSNAPTHTEVLAHHRREELMTRVWLVCAYSVLPSVHEELVAAARRQRHVQDPHAGVDAHLEEVTALVVVDGSGMCQS